MVIGRAVGGRDVAVEWKWMELQEWGQMLKVW